MAKLGDITIRYDEKTRVCIVKDRPGYFHCWEQYADVIAPGLTIGSHPGGQYSRVFGIVEFTDGVERVDPSKIKFIDEDHATLCALVDHFNAVGYPNPVSPEDLRQALNEKGDQQWLNLYRKNFFILDEKDMKKLSDGLWVRLIMDDETPPTFLFTEEGYKKFQEFWGEEDEVTGK